MRRMIRRYTANYDSEGNGLLQTEIVPVDTRKLDAGTTAEEVVTERIADREGIDASEVDVDGYSEQRPSLNGFTGAAF